MTITHITDREAALERENARLLQTVRIQAITIEAQGDEIERLKVWDMVREAIIDDYIDQMAALKAQPGGDNKVNRELLHQAIAVLRGCLEHPDADDAIAAIERALAQPVQPTSADYAMGYAEEFNDGCKPVPGTRAAKAIKERTS